MAEDLPLKRFIAKDGESILYAVTPPHNKAWREARAGRELERVGDLPPAIARVILEFADPGTSSTARDAD